MNFLLTTKLLQEIQYESFLWIWAVKLLSCFSMSGVRRNWQKSRVLKNSGQHWDGGGLVSEPSPVRWKGDKSQKLSKTCNAVVALILVTVPCGQSTFSLHIAFTHGWSLILAFFWYAQCTVHCTLYEWGRLIFDSFLGKCWILRGLSLTHSKVWCFLSKVIRSSGVRYKNGD